MSLSLALTQLHTGLLAPVPIYHAVCLRTFALTSSSAWNPLPLDIPRSNSSTSSHFCSKFISIRPIHLKFHLPPCPCTPNSPFLFYLFFLVIALLSANRLCNFLFYMLTVVYCYLLVQCSWRTGLFFVPCSI